MIFIWFTFVMVLIILDIVNYHTNLHDVEHYLQNYYVCEEFAPHFANLPLGHAFTQRGEVLGPERQLCVGIWLRNLWILLSNWSLQKVLVFDRIVQELLVICGSRRQRATLAWHLRTEELLAVIFWVLVVQYVLIRPKFAFIFLTHSDFVCSSFNLTFHFLIKWPWKSCFILN